MELKRIVRLAPSLKFILSQLNENRPWSLSLFKACCEVLAEKQGTCDLIVIVLSLLANETYA